VQFLISAQFIKKMEINKNLHFLWKLYLTVSKRRKAIFYKSLRRRDSLIDANMQNQICNCFVNRISFNSLLSALLLIRLIVNTRTVFIKILFCEGVLTPRGYYGIIIILRYREPDIRAPRHDALLVIEVRCCAH
jgi:hypothetical protein